MSRSSYLVSAAALVATTLLLLLVVQVAEARPSHWLTRPKRISDQRLAEIETLINLSKMKGKIVTVPVGFGKVDPLRIGRRRRSSTEGELEEMRLRRLLESLSPEELDRYSRLLGIRFVAQEPDDGGLTGDRDEDAYY